MLLGGACCWCVICAHSACIFCVNRGFLVISSRHRLKRQCFIGGGRPQLRAAASIRRCPRIRRPMPLSENMSDTASLEQEVQSLRDRLFRLNAASLRINESLDLETVLQGGLDGARSLTNARYGVISLMDDSGRMQDFFSSGLTPEEYERVVGLSDGPSLLEYLSELSEPLRVGDFFDLTSALGFPEYRLPLPVRSAPAFLAVPICHLGERIGHIYLLEQIGGQEFTLEDEEVLVMFASQAALVISNVRQYQAERRARGDLETLVEICPVGMAVFSARTGEPVSLNREAGRIASILLEPNQTPQDLLRVITVKLADGREFALAEHSAAQVFSTGETLHAEEVVLQVPDGRSVTVLLNAGPIHSAEGDVVSFVVTIQDMTELEESERRRAEFLGVVSHELRAPLASIKGSAATLVESGTTLDPVEMDLFFRIIEQQADRMSGLITDLLDMARIDTGTLPVFSEQSEPTLLVDQARNTFLSGGGSRYVHFDVEPDLPLVMADRRRIVQVLYNLLSNAAKHSPGASEIKLAVSQEDVHVVFSVTDSGRGLSSEHLPHLFRKFSRIDGDDRERDIEGSGMGLAICKGIVEAHGGRIWAESDGPGLGSRFSFMLPALIKAGLVTSEEPVRVDAHPRRARRDRTRVLVVDDDPQTLRYVRVTLQDAGYSAIVTGDPHQVSHLMEKERPHLVLLDLILPGPDGIELMESIPALARVPVIFLSVYGKDLVIARALRAGAADYLVKPFSRTELVARIETALRRRSELVSAEPTRPFRLGELTINYPERRVSVSGRAVQLTDIEYRLLLELSVNAGRVLTHEHLLQGVWGPGHVGRSGLVRTNVKNLRRKLGDDAGNQKYILTEPRVGYRMPNGEPLGTAAP